MSTVDYRSQLGTTALPSAGKDSSVLMTLWNYFLPMTSEVDWCEPNYVKCDTIAEFYNTISNIPLIIQPILHIILNREYTRRMGSSTNFIWALISVVGLSSIYFHSTLSRVGQLLDELFITWVVHATIGLLFPRSLLKQRNKSRACFRNLMIVSALVTSCLAFIIPVINPFVLLMLGVPCVYVQIVTVKCCPSTCVVKLGKKTCLIFLVAVVCWLSDKFLCNIWIFLGFPYLHSIFHVLMAQTACMAITSLMFLDAHDHETKDTVHLAYWPSSRWEFLGCPYVVYEEASYRTIV